MPEAVKGSGFFSIAPFSIARLSEAGILDSMGRCARGSLLIAEPRLHDFDGEHWGGLD